MEIKYYMHILLFHFGFSNDNFSIVCYQQCQHTRMKEENGFIKVQSHKEHLSDMLHQLMLSHELTDVTLISDDKRQFKGHKIVLCAYSKVFKHIIGNIPMETSVIYLQGIQHQELEAILEIMYLGEASFQKDRRSEFFNASKNLELKDINDDIHYDILYDNEKKLELENSLDVESEITKQELETIRFPSPNEAESSSKYK